MNTSGSGSWACMRTRSPRIAPPVNALLGSIASTAARSPPRRMRPTTSLESVDFPAPGAPVMPTIAAGTAGPPRAGLAHREPSPPFSTMVRRRASAPRSPCPAASASSAAEGPALTVERSLLGVVGDTRDARHAIHDDALDARLERLHRDRARAARPHQRHVHHAVGVD